jgi:hypothetical protein
MLIGGSISMVKLGAVVVGLWGGEVVEQTLREGGLAKEWGVWGIGHFGHWILISSILNNFIIIGDSHEKTGNCSTRRGFA